MRNLKRALSLALAAAMLISMMVIGASAAEYGDEASVSKDEAVEVLTAIGVVGGDQNGNFNPTATLTRAEFCVMVANALTGGEFDPVLFDGTNTPFTDVKGHWGANYIAYCYAVGVIAGTSATTFSPDATLTAAQASAILLSALGYNQNNEFGANGQFELNVTSWAQQAGLYANLSVSASKGISRENTAQLIFNALTNTTPVGYNTLANAYYTLGTNVLSGIVLKGDDLCPVLNCPSSNHNSQDKYESYQITLGYKNFDLTQTAHNVTDAFGRPAARWQYPVAGVLTPIGTYTQNAVLTYTKAVELGQIYQDLALSANKAAANVWFYEDGHVDQNSSNTAVDTINGKLNGADRNLHLDGLSKGSKVQIGGNGVLTQVYSLDNGDVVITMVNTYIGEVVSITNATATAGRKINIAGYTSAAGAFETDSFNREDVVLYTYSHQNGGAVQSVALAEKVTGQLTAYTTDKSAVVGGVTYEYGAKIDTTANNSELKIDVDVYLDQYGYAMDIEGVKTTSDYAFLLKYSDNGGTFGLDKVARLLKADGTIVDVKVAETKKGANTTWTIADGNDVATGSTGVVSYTVNSDDEYTLTTVDQMVQSGTKLEVTQGNANLNLGTADSSVTANGKTAFLVVTGTATKPVYTAYTGIANVPSIKWEGTTGPYYAYATEKGTATYVYIDARDADTISSDATEVVYILGDDKATMVSSSDGDYYEYDAVIDGTITKIKVSASMTALNTALTAPNGSAIYKSVNYNDKGIMVSDGGAGISGVGTSKVTNNTVGLNGSWYSYTDDVTVFRIDNVKETISVSTIGSIGTDSTDTVKFVTNATGKVVAIFIEDVISGGNSVLSSGHKVYVNGEEATLSTVSAAGATITSAVKAGDVITFAPAVSPMATATAGLNGKSPAPNPSTVTGTVSAGSNSYVVVDTDTGSKTLVYTVKVVAEDGTPAAADVTFTVTLPATLS